MLGSASSLQQEVPLLLLQSVECACGEVVRPLGPARYPVSSPCTVNACRVPFLRVVVICSVASRVRAARSAGLHEDAALPVEFQDLPQPLLGGGHAFFGPLAWGQRPRQ